MESAHEEGGVGSFFWDVGGVVIDLVLFVIGVDQELFEFSNVLPGFAEVERTKVEIEGFILEVLNRRGGTSSILK